MAPNSPGGIVHAHADRLLGRHREYASPNQHRHAYGNEHGTPAPTGTPVPEPTRTSTPVPQTSIVDQLRKNAEEFEYATGKHGGTLTFATISEPLTFNLAIANDASSSGVLGYLFEGLTETSWLTDEVEPMLQSPGSVRTTA